MRRINDKRINKGFVNILIVLCIIFMLNLTFPIISPIIKAIMRPTMPFIIGIIIAFCAQPFILVFENRGINRNISILIVLTIIGILFYFIAIVVIKPMIDNYQIYLNAIFNGLKEVEAFFGIPLTEYTTELESAAFKLIEPTIQSIQSDPLDMISKVIDGFTYFLITIIVTFTFLFNYEKIQEYVKKFIKVKYSRNTFNYACALNEGLTAYVYSQIKLVLFMWAQYTLIFFIIGHNEFLLVGFLCGLLSIVPIFGGLLANLVGVVLAFNQSMTIVIRSLIVIIVVPQIDGAITQPKIVGDEVNINPTVTLFAILVGSSLMGFLGLLICIPIAIVLHITYQFYKREISSKVTSFKSNF